MRRWWFRRRRPEKVLVIVDQAAYERLLEQAVVGAALQVIEDAQRRWLLMDAEERP